MIKKKYLISILFTVIIISSAYRDSVSATRRMMGPNIIMSWSSSYFIIDSGSVTVNDQAIWTYATGLGWFIDYRTTPYVSFRASWFCFPSVINKSYGNFNNTASEINLHDVGFSLLRYFNIYDINLWFGAGAYWQFSTLGDINSYVMYPILSLGFNYAINEDTYLCPEFVTGVGMRLIKKSADDVVIDVPTGRGFSSNGFIMFLKLGVAKTF